ncbi:F-box domain containing protein, partial [Tanacetum coccineum]
MENLYFPEEILNNIFVRLPTKSLFRFKSVSKHWNCSIPSPDFMKLRSHRMILLSVHPFHAIDTMDYSIIKLCSPFENLEGKDVNMVGTCNGIVLLALKSRYERDYMILYNPFTQASHKIHIPPSTYPHRYTYGLGYGTTPDDLKVVRLRDCSHYPGSCEVFSLKTRSWSIPLQATDRHGYGNLIVALDVKDMLFSEIQIPRE